MIGILVALKSILEIKAVAGALGALDAGLNIAGLLKILRSKVKRNSIEYQIICAIDDSLKAACKELGWEYDALAVSQELEPSKLLNSTVMTKAELGRLFAILVGSDIEDCDLDVIIDCFDKSVARKEELHRYLDWKWKRYIEEETIPPTDQADTQSSADFTPYYEFVRKRFTRKKQGEYEKLVGPYSDEEAYIDAYISVNHESVPVLSYLEKWFDKDRFGTLLICGEPGHGKSLLCNKAMFEYYRGEFLHKATNVLAVSLNTGNNQNIINNGIVNIEAALSWNDHPFTFEDCRGALLFMDGFDEFIDEAKNTKIDDIFTFMKKIGFKAEEHDIHIVVLSRTIAVSAAFEHRSSIRSECFKIMPITNKQQDAWLDRHSEYGNYIETFRLLRENRDMGNLLGIPFLFRMIVHSRFDEVSANTVELYDKLVDHLMDKRDIRGNELEQVLAQLRDLAYEIYCNDTEKASIDSENRNNKWIIAFYIEQIEKGIISFYHRSFYQYFLAKYILSCLLDDVTDKQAEDFIGLFAERELDDTVLQNLSLLINEENKEIIHNNLKRAVEALIRTEAYLNLIPRFQDGKAEKTKLGRTINVYRNTLHICAEFSYVIRHSVSSFIKQYPSNSITLYSDGNNKANLRRANLEGANMKKASLIGADLSGADLTGADLSGADLSGADLSEVDLDFHGLAVAYLNRANLSKTTLNNANLSGAKLVRAELNEAKLNRATLNDADLSGAELVSAELNETKMRNAVLKRANLEKSNLKGAVLERANLEGVNLKGANLEGANLKGANLGEANLYRANLNNTNLEEANLKGANLKGAYLTKTNLKNANIEEANFEEATLDGVAAIIKETTFRVKSIKNAKIDKDKKELIDPSIEGYETIEWVNKPKSE